MTTLPDPTLRRPPALRLPGPPPDVEGVAADYVRLRGGLGQLTAFVAVVRGAKPLLDDWIPVANLAAFRAFADSLGLSTAVDSAFRFVDAPGALAAVIGGNRLNTTRAVATPPWAPAADALAHVFVARAPEAIRLAIECGWYSLVVDGRVIEKPWIDHYHFGEALGYPECCRRFFAFHNEWNTENSLYQAARATRTTADARCNTLMKHSGFSWAWHLPCRFDCPATVAAASSVRAAVYAESRSLGEYVDWVLARPWLVLSEWEAFGFQGEVQSGKAVAYTSVFLSPTNRPDVDLYHDLRAADLVEVVGDVLRLSSEGRVVSTYRTVADRFGPQVPVVVEFG